MPHDITGLDLVLVFDTLYDADVSTDNPDERGGTWGVHYAYNERRQANVKLHLNGYLVTVDQQFINSKGERQTKPQYNITDKGRELLLQLKEAAGIE